MTVNEVYSMDQLAQEILASDNIEQLCDERAALLCPDDVARLKAIVDNLASKDFRQAARLGEAVSALGYRLGDDMSRAYAEAVNGRVAYCQGHYSKALKHYEDALLLMERLNKPMEVAILQKQQLGALMYLGRHNEARAIAARARRVLARGGEPTQLAELETNVGNLYCYLLGQYRRSLRYYQKAHAIFARLGNEVSLARVEYNLANALTHLDRSDEALAHYQTAAEIWHRHQMFVFAGQAEYNIAYLLFRRGQYDKALNYYYRALDNLGRLGDEVSVSWCNMDLAELYLQLSVFEESARLAEAARQKFLEFENTFQAAWAQAIGGLASAGLGQLTRARRELAAALEEFSRQQSLAMTGLIHLYLADLELRAGNYHAARINAQEAERIFLGERLGAKAALAQLLLAKLAYLTNEFPRARALLASIEKRASRDDLPWLEYEWRYLSGCLSEAAGERAQALAQFRAAIDLLDRLRSHICADELKSAFLHNKLDLFERAVALTVAGGTQERAAFTLVEQAKSRSLADLIAHYVEREIAGQLARTDLRERYHALLNELNWYASAARASREEENPGRRTSAIAEKRQRCEQELKELFRRIQIENADYAGLPRAYTADVAEIQQLLARDEAIIEYFSMRGGISAFVITRESFSITPVLATEEEIEELLEGLQFQLETVSFETDTRLLAQLRLSANDYLQRLHHALIEPLAAQCRGRALIVIPHGLLHYIPFHALFDGDRYLIEGQDLSYAPSATVWALCHKKETAAAGPLLIVGLPDNAAPHIEREIAELRALAPEAIVLANEEARLDNLKRHGHNCRILHIATHGVVRADNPLFSYLKMADGELTFYNTFELKLQAELVTLSACHTGINRIFPGDELHGLMRGFLYAGSPSLIASLWEADDRATTELMARFYGKLFAGETKRRALSEAQRELIKEYQHPFYWAPFLLLGRP